MFSFSPIEDPPLPHVESKLSLPVSQSPAPVKCEPVSTQFHSPRKVKSINILRRRKTIVQVSQLLTKCLVSLVEVDAQNGHQIICRIETVGTHVSVFSREVYYIIRQK